MARQIIFDNESSTAGPTSFGINGSGDIICKISATGTVKLRAPLDAPGGGSVEFDEFTESGVKSRVFSANTRLEAEITANTGNIWLEISDESV